MARYTAQEMRKAAGFSDALKANNPSEFLRIVGNMLRQAADDKERLETVMKECEKKREKKYEYARKFLDGDVSSEHRESPRMVFGDSVHGRMIVRREVGEWEDVTD